MLFFYATSILADMAPVILKETELEIPDPKPIREVSTAVDQPKQAGRRRKPIPEPTWEEIDGAASFEEIEQRISVCFPCAYSRS